MGGDAKAFGRTWWCRGNGAAVLVLAIAVGVFRSPHDPVFWFSLAFFVAHSALSVRRFLRERRLRTTATVVLTHPAAQYGIAFYPLPVNSLVAVDVPPKKYGK